MTIQTRNQVELTCEYLRGGQKVTVLVPYFHIASGIFMILAPRATYVAYLSLLFKNFYSYLGNTLGNTKCRGCMTQDEIVKKCSSTCSMVTTNDVRNHVPSARILGLQSFFAMIMCVYDSLFMP